MTQISLCLVITAVLVVSGHAVGLHLQSQCLPPMGQVHFDANKFSGEWYTVGKVESLMAKYQSECNRINYKVTLRHNITRINMDFSMKAEGKDVTYESTGQPVLSWMTSVIESVWKKTTDAKWRGIVTLSILATDYTSFAVFYACQPVYIEAVDIFDKIEVVSIWSRTPNMEPTLLDTLKNTITSYGINVDEMLIADNSKC